MRLRRPLSAAALLAVLTLGGVGCSDQSADSAGETESGQPSESER